MRLSWSGIKEFSGTAYRIIVFVGLLVFMPLTNYMQHRYIKAIQTQNHLLEQSIENYEKFLEKVDLKCKAK